MRVGAASSVELLIGSETIWTRAADDIASARSRLLVQAMTFEGDAAGRRVAEALEASRAPCRRVLADDYSTHVVNDRVLASPLAGAAARQEAQATARMYDGLADAGIGLRITNPIGRNPFRYPIRNHKKLILADDVAYLGGLNFSDHNFAWQDAMVRIADKGAADFLARDFEATWCGKARAGRHQGDGFAIHALDGRSNREGFEPLLAAIGGARRSIQLVSPYVTFPFLDALGEAATRGVRVEIVTPVDNNKRALRDYLLAEAHRLGILVRLLPTMTHAKALLIDESLLVMGSSNFDFVSWLALEEYLLFSTDAALIASLRQDLIEPAFAEAEQQLPYVPSGPRAIIARLKVQGAAILVGAARNARRGAIDWH